jgi:hypothetical protein
MTDKQFWLDQRRKRFETALESKFERASRVSVAQIIPGEYFARASYEAREFFIDGHFLGCISLCQSAAEGISKFLITKNNIRVQKMIDHVSRYSRLWRDQVITEQSRDAFKRIHGKDRNDIHHLNETIATDMTELEKRAEECLKGLFDIESDVFAYSFVKGAMIPKYPKYWPNGDIAETAVISLRQFF